MAIFWMLNLYDIEVPVAAYERTIEAVRKQLKDVADNIDMVTKFILNQIPCYFFEFLSSSLNAGFHYSILQDKRNCGAVTYFSDAMGKV